MKTKLLGEIRRGDWWAAASTYEKLLEGYADTTAADEVVREAGSVLPKLPLGRKVP